MHKSVFASLGRADDNQRHGRRTMADAKWPRRGEFVNMVLAWAVGTGDVNMDEVQFDGVAGGQFDKAIDVNDDDDGFAQNDLITMALQLGVPVEGLEPDGTLGAKWQEVVKLCKGEPGDLWFKTNPAEPRENE